MPSISVPYVPPVVPSVLGVPALFQAGAAPPAPIVVSGDAASLPSVIGAPQWGIFTSGGAPILIADAIASLEYAQDYRISDYPQEANATTAGTFESYNKVQLPYQAKVGYLIAQTRAEFLTSIGAVLASLNLVTVTSPEVSYANANLTHYAYRRTAQKGVTMILVEVWCEEVRVTATTSLSNATQSPNGNLTAQGGVLQPSGTTTTPISPVTGQLQSNLPNPGQPAPTGGALPQPNIAPAFYNADNLPQLPNTAAALSSAQQGSSFSYSQALGAGQFIVGPSNTDGSASMVFSAPASFAPP